MMDASDLAVIVRDTLQTAGLWTEQQEYAFPLIVKSATTREGTPVRFYYNYSGKQLAGVRPVKGGTELLSGSAVSVDGELELAPWGVQIILEQE